MKSLAIKIAFISLLLFVSVPIFKTQIDIKKMESEAKKLAAKIEYVEDKVEYARDKYERLRSGDEEVMKEHVRDSLGYYDPAEEIIYNDITN